MEVLLVFLLDMFIVFRERGRVGEREREREGDIDGLVASHMSPDWDRTAA